MSKVTIDDIARVLGMKPSEITDVEEASAGLVVRFTDGTAMVNVPGDQPDAAGQTGWMLLAAPVAGNKTYQGEALVYAPPLDDVDDPAPAGEEYPAGGSIEVVLGWVAGDLARAQVALAAEEAGKAGKARKTLVEELEAIIAQASAAQTGDAVDFERLGIEVPEGCSGTLNEDGTVDVFDVDGELVASYDADGTLVEGGDD